MIYFNDIRVADDGSNLYIEVEVPENPAYQDVHIKEILLDNQDSYIASPGTEKTETIFTTKENKKFVTVLLKNEDTSFNLAKDLLFITVVTDNKPTGDALPESEKSLETMKTACNLNILYKEAMDHIKELNRKCSVPDGFIDYILRVNALNICIKNGNYRQAIKYWNKFFNKDTIDFNCLKCELNG